PQKLFPPPPQSPPARSRRRSPRSQYPASSARRPFHWLDRPPCAPRSPPAPRATLPSRRSWPSRRLILPPPNSPRYQRHSITKFPNSPPPRSSPPPPSLPPA